MTENGTTFAQLGLNEALLKAVDEVGYEAPTPIQVQTIPRLLAGQDVIGQAQTGTGKTAAFALPILQKLDLERRAVQTLVLTPTRELSIQVAEAFFTYSRPLGNVQVLPVYGGQPIGRQINRLERGVQIVVGTPGRIMDHLRRGTLDLGALRTVVLDEADEMLRMGFLEDVEWILSQAPAERQTALFSATLPEEIRRIADRYLKEPQMVEVEQKTLTVPTIQQSYLIVPEGRKLETLAHLLEVETSPGEAALVFAGTKVGSAELAEKLAARGFPAEAMHGDMNQAQRENVIRRLRNGQLEIVVATDVAARGWDVERIALVVNYDIPHDTESYVHRIGRTGRAGRAGKSILFVTPRQKRMLRVIERYTGQSIDPIQMPTRADIAARRISAFKEQIVQTAAEADLDLYLNLVEELAVESELDMAEIAAAAASLARGERPLEVVMEVVPEAASQTEDGMVRLYLDAGRRSGVRPADIVGAIANEAGVPGQAIGAIDIYERYSLVDVPQTYLQQVLENMDGATIRNQPMKLRAATAGESRAPKAKRMFKPKGKRPVFRKERKPGKKGGGKR